MRFCRLAALGVIGFGWVATAMGAEPPPLADYFRIETAKLAAWPLQGIDSAKAWAARRPELHRRMLEMLGLWPIPEKTPLHAKVTGTVERPDFVIEKLLYESRPGLYVTGNLYRPKQVTSRLPAILYVCGHGRVEKDGIIYGCKAHYQHHPAWYAANGYVCLVVDTLQLGELPGLHHGTHHEGMWWWQSRGYTPAGVEAWNGVRAIDYLVSRPEVDATRIGVTGRSGGGATSWWVGAIDDRVAAVVPVAGITDLTNHVVDGVVEGHCDCMYITNTYRWDFATVAALVAPRPLLVENTDHDPIFPEDGVRRIFAQLEKVYAWYGASDKLDLVIGKGGHVDSTEIRHPSFAFFEEWLKGKTHAIVTEPDRKTPIELLKVLKPGEVPPGNRNDTIHESFIAAAKAPEVSESRSTWANLRSAWLGELRSQVFGGWPIESEAVALDLETEGEETKDGGWRLRAFAFTSQPGVRLPAWVLTSGEEKPRSIAVVVLGPDEWLKVEKPLKEGRASATVEAVGLARDRGEGGRAQAVAIVAPRGIGPTAWPSEKDTHLRRRFALLGQTVDGMRAWDVRRALAALGEVEGLDGGPRELIGKGPAASWALWAAVFEPEKVASVVLDSPPATVRDGPAFLNLDRVLGMPQALAMLHPRPVTLEGTPPEAWRWASDLGARISDGHGPWPRFGSSTEPEPSP